MIANLLEGLMRGDKLTRATVEGLFDQMLGGQLDGAQVAALLTAWRMRGETAEELAIGASYLRQRALAPHIPANLRPLADNCGTGGDGANSFNISTTAAIVAAAAGVRIAKHGNRGVSSRCGSADLLFAAGFPAKLSREAAASLLSETGLTFFFAPNFHPVMQHVGPIRKALGIRTIFNLLGPLANPIAPEFQLVGVGSHSQMALLAEALRQLGTKRALVVHSQDGLDEISPAAKTDYVLLTDGQLQSGIIDPWQLGINAQKSDLAGGDAAHNLDLLHGILANRARPGLTAAIALNAGSLLWLTGTAADLNTGYQSALGIIASGRAQDFFQAWIKRAGELS